MGDYIVGIDIGSSKVCTLIGRVNKDNQLVIAGKGLASCSGIKKGVIVDIESTANAVKESVEQAESMANLKVGSAYISIAGMHTTVINNRGWIGISGDHREITAKDVDKLLYSVRDVRIPEDRQVIDVIPHQFIVDGYDEILDPVGMVGVRLEVEADVVIGKITSVQNIVKSTEKSGIDIDGLILGAPAAGEILLSPDEKDMGVILIDVGGGITDISVFHKKRLVFYDSIPVGGDHITNDISIGLKIPYTEAEKIKRQYELALTSLIMNDQDISVIDINENRKKDIKVSEVVEIIEARVYEIFSLCRNMLSREDIRVGSGAGVVLAGGGISYVDGCKQLCGEVFELPVRVASYSAIGVSKPEFALAAGMIRYASGLHRKSTVGSGVRLRKEAVDKEEAGFWSKITKLLGRFF